MLCCMMMFTCDINFCIGLHSRMRQHGRRIFQAVKNVYERNCRIGKCIKARDLFPIFVKVKDTLKRHFHDTAVEPLDQMLVTQDVRVQCFNRSTVHAQVKNR